MPSQELRSPVGERILHRQHSLSVEETVNLVGQLVHGPISMGGIGMQRLLQNRGHIHWDVGGPGNGLLRDLPRGIQWRQPFGGMRRLCRSAAGTTPRPANKCQTLW